MRQERTHAGDPRLAHDDRTALQRNSLSCSVRSYRGPLVEDRQSTGLGIFDADSASFDRQQSLDCSTSEPNICDDIACAQQEDCRTTV
jgi:hypothetical protein